MLGRRGSVFLLSAIAAIQSRNGFAADLRYYIKSDNGVTHCRCRVAIYAIAAVNQRMQGFALLTPAHVRQNKAKYCSVRG